MTKQHILDEIRRAAQANGGVPLGRGQFEAETGIKESAWIGRYWARWGDAIREAGFTPNTLNPKTDEDVMLMHLATITRELGRYPTAPEMRLRKLQDSSFPNQKVFTRLGSRLEQITRLASFCERSADWSDMAAICQSMAPPVPEDAEPAAPGRAQDGWVYLALMRVGREKRFKIGKANLVEQRTRQIAVTLPETLELVHAIRTDDPYGIEAYWHNRFAEKRCSGEWFALVAADFRPWLSQRRPA